MSLFFYLFATLIIVSSICVVFSRHPIYSVLWLIFAFCNGSGIMVLLGAEFLAMMLVVIYVGAVAILFLFVIMMLDTHLTKIVLELKRNFFLSIAVASIMLADLVLIILLGTKQIHLNSGGVSSSDITNTHAIGSVLYTDFILPFQISGIILFVAMISCITLTLKRDSHIKRQNVAYQHSKNKANSVLMTTPQLNRGIEDIKYD